MRAAVYRGAGHVSFEEVPDPTIVEPTDAVVRVVRSAICGSDLWAYRGIIQRVPPARLGHEFLGVVEAKGDQVTTMAVGDLVIAPFQWSDNSCPACQDGLQTYCARGGTFGAPGTDGGQGEAVRVPQAEGTLVVVPEGLAGLDDRRLKALLATTDVAATGLHGAVLAEVEQGDSVVVIGDGAVGLCAVLGARNILQADRVILMSRNPQRQSVGRAFGATEVLPQRGEEGVAAVRELTGGLGCRHVVEAVGTPEAWKMAMGMVRDGGTIGSVGVPHTTPSLPLFELLRHHLRVHVGIAPVRHYLPDLISRVVAGAYDPGAVFDLEIPLEEVASGYAAMSDRRAIKVMLV